MENTRLIAPENGETVPLQTELQKRFSDYSMMDEFEALLEQISETGGGERSRLLPVTLQWETELPCSVVELSLNKDFSAAQRFSVSGETLELDNPQTGCTYYWRVNGSAPQCFCTEYAAPRWIHADGCENIRDCGSWTTADGKRLRQGLAYRGVKLEDSVTADGIAALRKLGIRTEIDLRAEAAGELDTSPLGADVQYVQFPVKGYDEFFGENTKDLFAFLADETNYPVYFHCAGGADRTGTLAFLLGAILGVDEETLLRDYEWTMLPGPETELRRSRWGELFLRLADALNAPENGEGDLCQKALRVLYRYGVTEETMQRIRDIFI